MRVKGSKQALRRRRASIGTAQHIHDPVKTRRIEQRGGVPYEVPHTVCGACGMVLTEEPIRRTAA